MYDLIESKDLGNGYHILVHSDDRVWDSLSDYSDWEDNSISHNGFPNVNINSRVFTGPSGLYSAFEMAREDALADRADCCVYAVKKWNETVEELKGTHTFEVEIDWNAVAQKVYVEQWKPLVDSMLNYIIDCEDDDFFEHIQKLEEELVLTTINFFQAEQLGATIYGFFNDESQEDNMDTFPIRQKFIKVLTELKVETPKQLDDVVEFFCLGEHYVHSFENRFMIVDPDIPNRAIKTVDALFHENNPYVVMGEITDERNGFHLSQADCYEDSDCFIISEKPDGYRNVLSGVNQFLHGDWYSASVVYKVEDEDKYKYEDQMDYNDDLEANVVDTNDSCCGFESVEAAFENFEHWAESEPPKWTPEYAKLGDVAKCTSITFTH